MTRTAPILRACAVLLALAAAGCGVRGAPAIAPPMFGETDLAPVVPQPYQQTNTVTVPVFPTNLYEGEGTVAPDPSPRAAEDLEDDDGPGPRTLQ